ncbi:MAG: sseA [Rhodospirillales bacterium]|nr:sseA [Rhodospirillales bacterium]
MRATPSSGLVSSEWLAAHLGQPGIVVLDATWVMKGTTPTAAELYAAQHIPGARRFDIDRISDHGSSLPHMLPTPEQFAAEVGLLGIAPDDLVVTYDAGGMASAAARVWWMFRVFGHDKGVVLDGGLPKWLADGRAMESGVPVAAMPKSYVADFRPHLVRDLGAIKAIAAQGGETLLDARTAGRFEGAAPEPWANGRGGHIPNSRSLPFTDLIDPTDKTLLPVDQLRSKLTAAGAADGPIVASCGSGVTACVIALALNEIGRPDVAVYDGSWAEWGLHTELPAVTGPA